MRAPPRRYSVRLFPPPSRYAHVPMTAAPQIVPPPVANDWLSPAINSDITGTNANIAAAYDTWAVLKATTLNAGNPWKITLPVPALSSGKRQFVAVQVDNTSTQMVSVVGNAGTENIGPGTATSRRMWAGECAVLETDGTNWFKVAGDTIPMYAEAARQAASQTLAGATVTKVGIDTSIADNSGLMFDAANNRLVVQRAGRYHITVTVGIAAGVATGMEPLAKQNGANTSVQQYLPAIGSSGYVVVSVSGEIQCAAGDILELWVYVDNANSVKDNVSGGGYPVRIWATEVYGW